MTAHPLTYAEHVALYQRQQLNRKRHQTELGRLAEGADAVEPPVVVIEPPDEEPEPVVEQPVEDIAAPAPPAPPPAVDEPAPPAPPPADDEPAPAPPAPPPPAPPPAAPQPAPAAEQPPPPTTPPSATPPPPTPDRRAEGHTTRSLSVVHMSTIMDTTIRLRLRIESGPDAGVRFALPEGEFVIGRDSDVDLRLTDETVSHHHAKLVVTARRATVEDLGSLNGTKFGTVQLRGVAILSPGDRITFGKTQVRVAPGDSLPADNQ